MYNYPLRYLKGVGPKREKFLKKLGIDSLRDLLYYFPAYYKDRGKVTPISSLLPQQWALIQGRVEEASLKNISYFFPHKKIKNIFKVILRDDRGSSIECLWFNQGYLAGKIKENTQLTLWGKVRAKGRRCEFIVSDFEIEESQGKLKEDIPCCGILSFYKPTSVLNQKFMRRCISYALKSLRNINDNIPYYIRKKANVINIAQALKAVHFPQTWEEAESARERFIFEELFFSQILVYLRKAYHRFQKTVSFNLPSKVVDKIKSCFPFNLTSSQNRVIDEILEDLKHPYPMHRLLQGDVGCGKTVCAATAAAVVASAHSQCAIMVPTEVLAYQHYNNFLNFFSSLNLKIEILTSSLKKSKSKRVKQAVKNGEVDIVVGTHSLLQEEIEFKNLGLVIVDEEHRFGVAQRALLPRRGKVPPHCLIMSATPIPRSLSLSLYGDMDLSVIREFPKNRCLAQTILIKEEKRKDAYSLIKRELSSGRQGYIIYPFIEENENFSVRSLKQMLKEVLSEFSEFSVDIFHSRLSLDKKSKVIEEFKKGKISLLVATTVVEVGVDVPNATVMLVESPERFGLSQLHQLRGRVQRAHYQSKFILIVKSDLTPQAKKRLEVISKVNDGFKIAEEDLLLRGPGEIFGIHQHGLPNLKIAHPLRDIKTLQKAKFFAYEVIKNDPYLQKHTHYCLREHLSFWFKNIPSSYKINEDFLKTDLFREVGSRSLSAFAKKA